MRVLLIEDDRKIAGFVRRALEEESNPVVVIAVGYPQGCWFQQYLIRNP